MDMDGKRFDEWNGVKKSLHRLAKLPRISEGDVYWCGFGENVGVEINGKNSAFSRPVVVLWKLSRYSFLGVPLTSREHVGTWYVEFEFLRKEEYAVLSQVRTLSVSRLYSRIGRLSTDDLSKIRKGFLKLYTLKSK